MNTFVYGKSLLRQDMKYVRVQLTDSKNTKLKPALIFLSGFDNVSGCGVTVCEELIAQLAQSNIEARVILTYFDVYIFPNINPDCELLGNSFCSASGTDLRTACQFTKVLQPELFYLHRVLSNIRASQPIELILEVCGGVDG